MTQLKNGLLVLMLIFSAEQHATTLTIDVTDLQGAALTNAVVELTSTQGATHQLSTTGHYEMVQQNRIFAPFVLAVPKGAVVHFPNLDRTRHHVYSFSEAKQFELKLYVGTTEEPIPFDKPGVVAIGCNIHDYMQAFIYVAKSPYFSMSDAKGKVHLTDIPAGEYQVNLWHPWQKEKQAFTAISVTNDDSQLTFSIDIEQQDMPSSPPSGFGAAHHLNGNLGQHAK